MEIRQLAEQDRMMRKVFVKKVITYLTCHMPLMNVKKILVIRCKEVYHAFVKNHNK